MVQSKYTIKRTELAKKTKNNKIDKKITKKVDKTLDSTSIPLSQPVPDTMTVPDIIVPDIIEPTVPDIVDIKPTKICQLKEKKKRKELETKKLEENKIETNENIKKILITNENELIDETPPVKLKINKIGFKVAKVSVNSNLVVDHVDPNTNDQVNRNSEGSTNREDVVDKGDVEEEGDIEEGGVEEAPRKRKEVSKECMQLAIKILKKIDPKNQMKKEDVIIILKEYSQSVNDLSIIQAVEYLLDSFDNLEENFKNFEETRIKQEKGLFKKEELDKETFKNRISLDSEDREPDENDRIFRQGKEIFSGSFQKYKKLGNLEVEKFKSIIAPKKDLKKLKQYGLA